MKDRQRWQPEEDALLFAYVKQYGPREWNLVSERMGKILDRDAKSCIERWKNYLKPGIKKGPLSEEEQYLVINLQAKYGNKWKKIAAEVPGRTAKRLGKWWEVYKEKQQKEKQKDHFRNGTTAAQDTRTYDGILATFAEKLAHKNMVSDSFLTLPGSLPPPLLALGVSTLAQCNTEPTVSPCSVTMTTSPVVPVSTMEPSSRFSSTPGACGSALISTLAPLSSGLGNGGAGFGPSHLLSLFGPGSQMASTCVGLKVTPPGCMLDLQCGLSTTEAVTLPPPTAGSSNLPPWMSNMPSIHRVSSASNVRAVSATAALNTETSHSPRRGLLLTSPSVGLSLSSPPGDAVIGSSSASSSQACASKNGIWIQDLINRVEEGHGRAGTDERRRNLESAWCPMNLPAKVDPVSCRPIVEAFPPNHLMTFLRYCKELEDGRQSWFAQKKESGWKLKRLEQQLESEKARKRREKIDEVEAKIRALKEEEMKYLEELDVDYKEKISSLHKDAEQKEANLVELWTAKHLQFTAFLEQIVYCCADVQRSSKAGLP